MGSGVFPLQLNSQSKYFLSSAHGPYIFKRNFFCARDLQQRPFW
jgi:hypothetical protein